MTELTALDVIRNMTLSATMAIIKDLGDTVDQDDKSRAIADLVAKDLLERFNQDYLRAQAYAADHGLKLTVTLACD